MIGRIATLDLRAGRRPVPPRVVSVRPERVRVQRGTVVMVRVVVIRILMDVLQSRRSGQRQHDRRENGRETAEHKAESTVCCSPGQMQPLSGGRELHTGLLVVT